MKIINYKKNLPNQFPKEITELSYNWELLLKNIKS